MQDDRAEDIANGGYDLSQQQYVLWRGIIKASEEMAELQQVLAKLMVVPSGKHWDEAATRSDGSPGQPPLRQRAKEECADVLAAVNYFVDKNFTDIERKEIHNRVYRKLNLYEEWKLSGVPEGGLK